MSVCLTLHAQFYDSDNEVRIYVQNICLDRPGTYPPIIRVFNFNGTTAAKLSVDGDKILEDENYFEKRIFGEGNEIIKFHEEGSNNQRTRYRHGRWSPTNFGFGPGETTYTNYDFSPNGNEFTDHSGTKFTRITKDKYIQLLLAYKNKTTKKWR